MSEPAPRMHTGSLLQVLLSALGLATCAVGAGFLLVSGWLLLQSGSLMFREQASMLISLAWTLGFLAVIALPSLIFASQRLSGKAAAHETRSHGLRNASLAMLLWPVVLAGGRTLATQSDQSAFLLPPLQILAVGLPLWWLVELARDRLPASSAQRTWGVLNFSLFFTTPLVILVEILILLIGLAAVVAVVSASPEWVQAFEELSRRIINSVDNPQALLRIYRPLLSHPWVIFALLVSLSVVVPLVEELLKPLAVWALAGRQLTPGEGFGVGAICGAAFAMLETLFSFTNPLTDGWLTLAVGRAGTGLLHIVTAALMGFALASAWRDRRYLRLGVTYFAVVVMHGLWNALSVAYGLGQVVSGDSALARLVSQAGTIAPYGLGLLAFSLLVVLLVVNFVLRRRVHVTSVSEAG